MMETVDYARGVICSLNACRARDCYDCKWDGKEYCQNSLMMAAAVLISDLMKELGHLPAKDGTEPKQPITRTSILEDARRIVCGEREGQYGTPEDSFSNIAKLWSAYCERDFTPMDVAVMMALLKVARIKNSPSHEDSWVDGCGYLACGGEIAGGVKGD